jgi:hypothetical protein
MSIVVVVRRTAGYVIIYPYKLRDLPCRLQGDAESLPANAKGEAGFAQGPV